jgi:hypothetical protein
MTKLQNDKTKNDETTKWQNYKMTKLQNDQTTKWPDYKMTELQNDNFTSDSQSKFWPACIPINPWAVP